MCGNVHKLLEPLVYVSEAGETITVPAGQMFDGNSVPKPLQLILDDWDDYGRAGVLHDWLYRTKTKTKAEADALHYEALLSLGCPKWKALAAWSALRALGWIGWTHPSFSA